MTRNKDIALLGVVDSNYETLKIDWGEVRSPELIKTIDCDLVVVAVNSEKTGIEITNSLADMGINKEMIIWKEPISF